MVSVGISFLTSVILGVDAVMATKADPSAKTRKITEGIRKLLLFAPAIVIAIFTVLFCTVLKGRLVERSSHALIVLCLWLYGTAFYVIILRFFKSRSMLILSVLGMIMSVALAIFLTPLDRYCSAMFAAIHGFTFVLGGVMLVFWYFIMLKKARINR
jgi:hypothetical protein